MLSSILSATPGAGLAKDAARDIRSDVFEKQLLISFDVTAWIESQVRRMPLQEVLKSRFE